MMNSLLRSTKYYYNEIQKTTNVTVVKALELDLKFDKLPSICRLDEIPIEKVTCAILNADLVNYTRTASKLESGEAFSLVRGIFCQLDSVCKKYDFCKIHTIGDCYVMTNCHPKKQNAQALSHFLKAAKEMQELIIKNFTIKIRIGIHFGDIYFSKPGELLNEHYDVFGPCVYQVGELQSFCEPSKIIISKEYYDLLNTSFPIIPVENAIIPGYILNTQQSKQIFIQIQQKNNSIISNDLSFQHQQQYYKIYLNYNKKVVQNSSDIILIYKLLSNKFTECLEQVVSNLGEKGDFIEVFVDDAICI